MSKTSMQISNETLDKLHALKNRGETYEDVVLMLLRTYENCNTSDNYK